MQKYLDEFCNCESCKTSTYKNYALSLAFLDKNNVDWLDMDAALGFLSEQSLSRRLACLSAMKTYARDVTKNMEFFNKLAEPLQDVHNLRRKKYTEQKRTPDQEKNWIDLKCLRKQVKALTQDVFALDKHSIWSNGEYQQAQLALFMGYMTTNPCRRDLCTLVYNETKGNFVDADAHTFVFNEYKTKKFHGTVTVPLNRDLWKLYSWIRSQHRLLQIQDGRLFRNTFMRPMTRGALGCWLKSMCKKHLECCCEKNVTCNLLRHLVCTKEYENTPLLLQRQHNAKMRMHTAKTSEEYRVL